MELFSMNSIKDGYNRNKIVLKARSYRDRKRDTIVSVVFIEGISKIIILFTDELVVVDT
jgi:hypothetical protein